MPEIIDYPAQATLAATDVFIISEADGTVKTVVPDVIADKLEQRIKDIFADMMIGRVTAETSTVLPYRTLWIHGEQTIGNTGSGATFAGPQYETLFEKLKTSWGNAGTEIFASGDTVKLPNSNAVVFKGVGSQTINTRSKSGPTLGALQEDQIQGHYHSSSPTNIVRYGIANNYNIVDGLNGDLVSISIGSPTTDGTNGDPRTGATTQENCLGIYYVIGY